MWGLEEPGELDRLLVVSPHLDDAVMSCGALLLAHPGATVVTLFAASPAHYTDPLNEHDTECGFRPGDDTMALRRDEDVRAMAAVGATPRWLAFCQNSHEERVDPIAVPPGAVDALAAAIDEVDPTCVVAPLGLSHADHQACHSTALAARAAAGAGSVALVQRPSLRVHPGCARGAIPRAAQGGTRRDPVVPERCRSTSPRSGARSASTRRRYR